jgi:hypothetical protein
MLPDRVVDRGVDYLSRNPQYAKKAVAELAREDEHRMSTG